MGWSILFPTGNLLYPPTNTNANRKSLYLIAYFKYKYKYKYKYKEPVPDSLLQPGPILAHPRTVPVLLQVRLLRHILQ